jgi:hypothetical protein
MDATFATLVDQKMIAVIRDEPVLIQVKRRTQQHAVEGVDVVKLLFASAFAQNARSGMVITTAKKFSTYAHGWTRNLELRDNQFNMQLKKMSDLMSMVDAVAASSDPEPWQIHEHKLRSRKRIRCIFSIHVAFLDGDLLAGTCAEEPCALLFDHAGLEECTVVRGGPGIAFHQFHNTKVEDFRRFLSANPFVLRTISQSQLFAQWDIPTEQVKKLESRWRTVHAEPYLVDLAEWA